METGEVAVAHRFAEQRLRRYAWRYPVTAMVLGLATAALGWMAKFPDAVALVVFIAVFLLHMYGMLVMVGTPARAGVVPRHDDNRSKTLLWFACIVVLSAPVAATLGSWWQAPLTGGIEVLLLLGYGRNRLAADIAGFGMPPRTEPTRWTRFVVRTVRTTWFAPVAMFAMGVGVVAMVLGDRGGNLAGLLTYYPAAILLAAASFRVRPRRRTLRTFLLGLTPLLLVLGAPWLLEVSDSVAVAVAAAAGLVVMAAVAVVGRWVRSALPATSAVP
jgi:hypothetical protein